MEYYLQKPSLLKTGMMPYSKLKPHLSRASMKTFLTPRRYLLKSHQESRNRLAKVRLWTKWKNQVYRQPPSFPRKQMNSRIK
jgi:hypothetical protein